MSLHNVWCLAMSHTFACGFPMVIERSWVLRYSALARFSLHTSRLTYLSQASSTEGTLVNVFLHNFLFSAALISCFNLSRFCSIIMVNLKFYVFQTLPFPILSPNYIFQIAFIRKSKWIYKILYVRILAWIMKIVCCSRPFCSIVRTSSFVFCNSFLLLALSYLFSLLIPFIFIAPSTFLNFSFHMLLFCFYVSISSASYTLTFVLLGTSILLKISTMPYKSFLLY